MAFNEQLKKLMIQNEMKAVDLARATALSEAAISDYLKGKKEPRGRQSISIAKALNVSLDILWETNFDKQHNLSNVILTENENSLLSQFCILNHEGQNKILTYTQDLIDTEKYQAPNQSRPASKKYRYKFNLAARGKGIIEQIIDSDSSPIELARINKETATKRDDSIF